MKPVAKALSTRDLMPSAPANRLGVREALCEGSIPIDPTIRPNGCSRRCYEVELTSYHFLQHGARIETWAFKICLLSPVSMSPA